MLVRARRAFRHRSASNACYVRRCGVRKGPWSSPASTISVVRRVSTSLHRLVSPSKPKVPFRLFLTRRLPCFLVAEGGEAVCPACSLRFEENKTVLHAVEKEYAGEVGAKKPIDCTFCSRGGTSAAYCAACDEFLCSSCLEVSSPIGLGLLDWSLSNSYIRLLFLSLPEPPVHEDDEGPRVLEH